MNFIAPNGFYFIDIGNYKIRSCVRNVLNRTKSITLNGLRKFHAPQNIEKFKISSTEYFVLYLLHLEYTAKEISTITGRSIKTISNHKRNAMRKMNISNNAALFDVLRNIPVVDEPFNTDINQYYPINYKCIYFGTRSVNVGHILTKNN
ncbi:helix-turn-helix transcriptional regulator [Serratia fonticola]|uniref:helix-turn-helix transcriptional regulator n=1 Tax=Serratia fonticola TaxID=47917 RepID=UPI003CC80886